MTSTRMVICIILLAITSVVVVKGALTDQPPLEGKVVGKNYTPAHWIFTGKTSVFIPESWGVTIEKCDESNPPKCQTGYYSVSHNTYNDTQYGDYVHFNPPGQTSDVILRLFLGVIGLGCLAAFVILLPWLLELKLRGWVDGIMGAFLVAALVFLFGIGEVLMYLTAAGPTGYL